jgi:hypothetical protein
MSRMVFDPSGNDISHLDGVGPSDWREAENIDRI